MLITNMRDGCGNEVALGQFSSLLFFRKQLREANFGLFKIAIYFSEDKLLQPCFWQLKTVFILFRKTLTANKLGCSG